ncbi:hypothetical protein BTU51_0028 [Rickettsia rickettsii]|uniref:Uncharacterized protein n=2 Tax=Rickettsia rickettsii TaxID=783 RepID=B0BVT3_RICRO|nr:hypothetical protein A1G_00125 [Rickettsia rickettsii str. 'Sheila Smith']ABY71959.1 hypothetical protein RrIowa_0028 [Rickettsia rickettsii str. Iowa]AFB22956.1 hypothetical protein RPL_00125 [Rickettsia rickettsii str. Colombia]AFB26993.1 hypothetical protein RPJ_00125 [Rickettsia rickettsii str. Hino]AFB29650.1 hypothetical protein RPM_00125 [Rickettsia rickettsii str. Hauke]APU54911.1 hypothetical protein BTU50_0028 [Rickettsia rickettsii]
MRLNTTYPPIIVGFIDSILPLIVYKAFRYVNLLHDIQR